MEIESAQISLNFGSMHFNSINLKYLGRYTLKCNVSQFQLATKKSSDTKFSLTYWIDLEQIKMNLLFHAKWDMYLLRDFFFFFFIPL